MSSVPKVPPETMKKVATTRGHKVSRTNCCFWDFAGGGVSCGFLAGELVAVANFDVVLPSDSLSPPRPLPPRLLVIAIPGIREVGSRFREYSHLDAVEKEFLGNFLLRNKDGGNFPRGGRRPRLPGLTA